MKAPQPIPYQGSKRHLAPLILSYFPNRVHKLIEPFAGSAAVSVAAAISNKARYFIINDINSALIDLLREIVNHPQNISDSYKELWFSQLGKENYFYQEIRDKFNKTKAPDYFLYILARCVKGAIRYNSNGEFNQSPDNRRKGKKPENMQSEIFQFSSLLKNRVAFYNIDYREILNIATEDDLIYMDPPYQGTCESRDPRYYSGVKFEDFVDSLHILNRRNIAYIISYDGKTGEKNYGNSIPKYLNLLKINVEVGRSTQSTLLGKDDVTHETIYLSSSLVKKNHGKINENVSLYPKQMSLFEPYYEKNKASSRNLEALK